MKLNKRKILIIGYNDTCDYRYRFYLEEVSMAVVGIWNYVLPRMASS